MTFGAAPPAEADTQKPPEGLARVVAEGLAKNDLVLLGDTKHGDAGLQSAFTDKGLIDRMAAGGVKHMFLEIPAGFQPKIEALQEGRMDKQAFVAAYKSSFENMHQTPEERDTGLSRLADSIVHAAQKGIKVHAADAGLAGDETRRYDDALEAAYLIWRDRLSPKDQALFDLWQSGREAEIPREERHDFMLRRERALHHPDVREAIAETDRLLAVAEKARLDDSKTYDIIASTLQAGEKGVVVYGNRHYQSLNGLDNFLAHDFRVARIDVHPSGDSVSLSGGGEKPQTVFIVDQNRAYDGGGSAPVPARPPKP